jgi:nitrogen fixation protein FixH
MKFFGIVLAVVLSFVANGACAHSDEYFDANPSPHGGQVRMAGAYHFELIVEPGALTVYVTDHANTPIATDGAQALAVVDVAKTRTRIKLEPAGTNVLKGQGEFAAEAAMRVKLTVTMPGAKSETARFAPLKNKARTAKP